MLLMTVEGNVLWDTFVFECFYGIAPDVSYFHIKQFLSQRLSAMLTDREHPLYSGFKATDTGQIITPKGKVVVSKDKWCRFRYQKKSMFMLWNRFVYECFFGITHEDDIIDTEDDRQGSKPSNLVKVTAEHKKHRDIAKIETVRNDMESTCVWRTHPFFTDYLGSKQGEVFSLKTRAIIKGQTKKPYEYITMNLTTNNDNVYITQHKFIYECFHGILDDACEITHCNLIEKDNALENLKLLKEATEEDESEKFEEGVLYDHPKYSLYAADTDGNVYIKATEEKLKYEPNRAGYIELKLKYEERQLSVQAHRFVYETFHGLIDEGLQIDHRNARRSANNIRNLTALGTRAHNKKTRKDNPEMSAKRAATCSKALLRVEVDTEGIVTATTRYDSAKAAVIACGSEFKRHAIGDAIRHHSMYKGFLWQYEEAANLPGEIWKTLDCDEMKGIVVSNLGRVKTSYGVSFGSDNGHGYMCINLGNQRHLMHVLVCWAFHGAPPVDMVDPTVDHKDRKRSHNAATNLRWADRDLQSDNRSTTKKVAGYLVDDNTVTFGPFDSVTKAGKAMSVDASSISACCTGKRLSAGTYKNSRIGWKDVMVEE